MVIHHANKDSMRNDTGSEQYAARGSSAFTDGVRWQGNLRGMTDNEARKLYGINPHDRKDYVNFSVSKMNGGKRPDSVWLKRSEDGYLSFEKLMSNKERQSASHYGDVLSKVKEFLTGKAAQGKEYSRKAFATEYGYADGPLQCSNNKLKDILNMAVEQGELELKPSKKRKGAKVLHAPPDQSGDEDAG